MSERRKPDQEIIYQLEQIARVLGWAEDVGYPPPIPLGFSRAWLDDYIENLRDRSAN